MLLDQELDQRKEELRLLQDCIAQRKADLKEALRDGETDVTEKRRQIRVNRLLPCSVHYLRGLVQHRSQSIFQNFKEILLQKKGRLAVLLCLMCGGPDLAPCRTTLDFSNIDSVPCPVLVGAVFGIR